MNANVKSRQFCSVCKQWLDMEVFPTSDGDDDDGVIWFRCPQCQGFLPKLSGGDLQSDPAPESDSASQSDPGQVSSDSSPDTSDSEKESDGTMPWDSPADMMAAMAAKADPVEGTSEESTQPQTKDDDPLLGDMEAAAISDLVDIDELETLVGGDLPEDETEVKPESAPEKDDRPVPEPIMEYAALLAETDISQAVPYRHWGTYEVGQCIHHLAWDDCGVVVAKEDLPGGRQVIKVYFEEAGVVRLIEKAPR